MKILNWHEVVNDEIDDVPIVITYCPLCGSGIVFEAEVNGEKHTFGVSGLLYNSDVLLYDRETQSLWSQLMSKAISGPNKGDKLKMIPTQNTSWIAWKSDHPKTLVLSTETGYDRNYNRDPYIGYDQSERIYFPVKKTNDRYHPKELIFGVSLNGINKAYSFEELSKTDGQIIDTLDDTEIIITFDKTEQSAKARTLDGSQITGVTAYWFAWYAFNPDTDLFVARKK